MTPIPKRLKKEPLIEVIWQAQFDAPNAGDLLPGVLFETLRKSYSPIQMRRLPTADIPAILTQADPNLRYLTKIRIEAEGRPYIWQVGDRSVAINCRKPYVGWPKFKAAIEDFIEIIASSHLVPNLERHSLRYLDLLTLDPAPNISAVKLSMRIGSHEIKENNLRLRVEIPDIGCTHIVQIVSPAEGILPEGKITGTLIDLETAHDAPQTDWDGVRSQLDELHARSKELFFRHILANDALEKMEPEYT